MYKRDVLRLAVAAAVLVLTVAPLHAQTANGAAAAPGVRFHLPPSGPPLPAPPVPPAGRPHHVPPAPPPTGADLFLADRHTYAPRFTSRPRARVHPSWSPHPIGALPYFGSPAYPGRHAGHGPGRDWMGEAVGHDGGSIPHADAAGGYLQLEVAPAAARIFVDGFFMGSAADVMAPLALAAGPHRIEVMADGFQATAFTARVRPHETLRFAIRLDRLAADETRVPSPPASRGIGTDAVPPTEAPAPMPAVAKTLYVIPRCYAGDRPPDASALPAGCRAADVRVIAPGRR